jgi:hypothetical protein
MDSESRLPTASLASQSSSLPPPRRSRFDTMRGRVGRILVACILFLLGLLCGIIGVLVLLFAVSSDNSPVANPGVPASSDIVVQVGTEYITHIVSNALQSSGLPGNIQNVQVTLAIGDSATLVGDDQISVLGIGTTRHFTIVIQPYIASCQVHVHVLHADLGGIAVTGFASLFEGQINSQIQVNTTKLPSGFTYCTSSVRTEPQGVFVTYSAKPA